MSHSQNATLLIESSRLNFIHANVLVDFVATFLTTCSNWLISTTLAQSPIEITRIGMHVDIFILSTDEHSLK